MNINKFWIEMKFKDVQPNPRTLHSSASFREKLYIYGGTDILKGDSAVNEFWTIKPLLKE